IAHVINRFLGETTIPKDYIGKSFCQGTKFEGGPNLENPESSSLERRIIRMDGKVFFSTYPVHAGEIDSHNQEKIALLISALFGFEEARIRPSQSQEAVVTSLRRDMLPVSVIPELLQLPIVALGK